MKAVIKILIFLFFLFISIPTIISLVGNEVNKSYFVETIDEVENDCEIEFEDFNLFFSDKETFIILHHSKLVRKLLFFSENFEINSLQFSIFIPPPDLI